MQTKKVAEALTGLVWNNKHININSKSKIYKTINDSNSNNIIQMCIG